jgi:hypothetical protein
VARPFLNHKNTMDGSGLGHKCQYIECDPKDFGYCGENVHTYGASDCKNIMNFALASQKKKNANKIVMR